jgi:hypothetical protein
MNALMYLQKTLLPEWPVTCNACVWTFSAMYAMLSLQSSLLPEGFIIHITPTQTIFTKYAIGAPSDYPVQWMISYKHHVLHYFFIPFSWRSTLNDLLQYHTYVNVLKYVCVDVHSNHSSPWMIYYKHHVYQDVLQAGIGATSDYPVQWTNSYKHRTQMNILSSEEAAPWTICYKHLMYEVWL